MLLRNFLSTICIALFVAVGAWTASWAPAHAGDWKSLNPTDFPAHVRAIILPSGNRIDSSSSTCWGKWCVTFGPKPPVARLLSDGVVMIVPLACKNPVEGVGECSLILKPSRNLAKMTVRRRRGGDDNFTFDIRVPKDLILE